MNQFGRLALEKLQAQNRPKKCMHIYAVLGSICHYNETISILYGGSCKPSNAQAIFSQKDVDGGLIGGASLNSEDFIELINLRELM